MRKNILKKFFIIILILLSASACSKEKLFSVHVIDVGQGDSILIKTISNKNILVDAGDEEAEHTVYSYLKRNGVHRIDILIATHPDTDHIGGMDYIVDKFKIVNFFMPNCKANSESYYNLIDSCRNNNVKIEFLSKGDSLKIDSHTKIDVLQPATIVADKNNLNSIVFLLTYDGHTFLFTGDAEKENEADILSSYDISNIDFLKAGHHGSSSSSTKEFIERLKPNAVAISCGYHNDYGHPHRSVLETFRENNCIVYRTDKNGSLVFYCDKNGLFTKRKYIIE